MAIRVKNPLPKSKYKPGTYFRNLDTEQVFKLNEVRLDTYILVDDRGFERGESLFTLEYDYELVKEGENLFYGKRED